jgi:hypothetical protein
MELTGARTFYIVERFSRGVGSHNYYTIYCTITAYEFRSEPTCENKCEDV